MMPADVELKPCPFCGGKPYVWPDGDVGCASCSGAVSPARWNHRAPIDHDRVLVPMEPTEEMIAAAIKATGEQLPFWTYYKAMLSAAPKEK